ncbi:MAG TPA: four helix bundle protein [Acidimicrobiia bacterium]
MYAASATFPPDERFGLTQQLRRAAVSIASNIAEGCGRDTDADLARFLSIAAGSTSECESQIATAGNLGFLEEREAVRLMDQAEHIRRQLHKLALAVRATRNWGRGGCRISDSGYPTGHARNPPATLHRVPSRNALWSLHLRRGRDGRSGGRTSSTGRSAI